MKLRSEATLPTCLKRKTSELSSRSPSTATPKGNNYNLKKIHVRYYRQSHIHDIQDVKDRLKVFQEFQIVSFQLKS